MGDILERKGKSRNWVWKYSISNVRSQSIGENECFIFLLTYDTSLCTFGIQKYLLVGHRRSETASHLLSCEKAKSNSVTRVYSLCTFALCCDSNRFIKNEEAQVSREKASKESKFLGLEKREQP